VTVIVNVKLDLCDDDLRRIRAIVGRGGVATRTEVRTWVDRLVQGGLRLAPEPKRRTQAKRHLASCVQVAGRWLCAADCDLHVVVDVEAEQAAVTDATRCRHCKRTRESHGKMLLTCLPGFGAPAGSRFSPARET
jgi:hypothetical protein